MYIKLSEKWWALARKSIFYELLLYNNFRASIISSIPKNIPSSNVISPPNTTETLKPTPCMADFTKNQLMKIYIKEAFCYFFSRKEKAEKHMQNLKSIEKQINNMD